MRKGLIKTIGLLLLLLFIGGTVLIPTYHKVHCEDHPAAGNDTHCPICQVANTPCITPLSLNAIDTDQLVVGFVPIACPLFVAASPCFFSQSRAPPVS
jgi:hypothetical protein